MNATLKTITPAMAAEMLEKNTRNRPLNASHVKKLAREMQAGRWKVNGDTICFNGDVLVDGQHRLAAGVESGCSFVSLVVEGLSSDVFDTKDTGKRRSGGDTLALIGVANANAVAATVVFVERLITGKLLIGRNGSSGHTYNNAEIQALYEKYAGVEDSVRFTQHKSKVCPGSVLAGLHYLFSLRDGEAADRFVNDLKTGADLQEGDGVYLLRERLLQNSFMKQRLRNEYIAALAIKAWNARRTNKKLGVLKFTDKEDFPLIAD